MRSWEDQAFKSVDGSGNSRISSDQPFYFLFYLSCGQKTLLPQTFWYFTVVNKSCNPSHDPNCLQVRVFHQQCVKTIFALYDYLKRSLIFLASASDSLLGSVITGAGHLSGSESHSGHSVILLLSDLLHIHDCLGQSARLRSVPICRQTMNSLALILLTLLETNCLYVPVPLIQ